MTTNQIIFNTEKRKLKDLIPATYNPRKMTEEQNTQLRKSLEKFGLAEIPVINKDNTILAGHQRIRLLADLEGVDFEIDVRVPNRLLTEVECKEYNIKSNKIQGMWDWDILANQFEAEDLFEWGIDFGVNFDLKSDEVVTEKNNGAKKFYTYEMIFDNKDQIDAWKEFVQKLKNNQPDTTLGELLYNFICKNK